MVKKCTKRSKGGDCLQWIETSSSSPAQSDQERKENREIDLPKPIKVPEAHIPAVGYQRGAKQPAYKPDKGRPGVIMKEPQVDYSKHQTASYEARRVNRAAVKANLAVLGVDFANYLMEHADEIESAADLARMLAPYAQEIVDQTPEAVEELYTALTTADVTVSLPALTNLLGIPLATRTIDNVGQLFGFDLNTTDALLDVERDVAQTVEDVRDKYIPEEVQSVAQDITDNTVKYGFAGPLATVGQAIGGAILGLFK